MNEDDSYCDGCEWCVEVGYCCPGQLLDSEYEGLLEFTSTSPLLNARFSNGRRYVSFYLKDKKSAEQFANFAAKNRENVVTEIRPEWPEDY